MLLTCVSSEIILQYWGQNRCTYHLNDAFPNTAYVKEFKMFFQSFLFLPCPRAVPVPMSDSTVCSLLRGEEGVAKYSPVSCPTSVCTARERETGKQLSEDSPNLPPPPKYIATMPMFQTQSEKHCNAMLLTVHLTHVCRRTKAIQYYFESDIIGLQYTALHSVYMQHVLCLYIYTNLPLAPKYTITPV